MFSCIPCKNVQPRWRGVPRASVSTCSLLVQQMWHMAKVSVEVETHCSYMKGTKLKINGKMGNKTPELFIKSGGRTFLKEERENLHKYLIYVSWLQPGFPAHLSKAFLSVMTSPHKTYTLFTPLLSWKTFPSTFGDGDHFSCASSFLSFPMNTEPSCP